MLGISNKTIQKFKISLVFTKTNINVIILSVFIGICEEFAYRQLWFNILFKDFKMNIAISFNYYIFCICLKPYYF